MPRPLRAHLRAALLVILPVSARAAQNDFFPTDMVALPDGSNNVALYAAHQSLSGLWTNGTRTTSGELSMDLLAVRAARHYTVGEHGQYTVAPLLVLSASDLGRNAVLAAAGPPTSGFADLRIGGAFWFHVDRENRDYALATLSVSLPTGDYSSASTLNIGENRVKTVLALGWMKTLDKRWVLELSPEVAFFGDNTKFAGAHRLSQDTAYAVTGTLRHKFTQGWHVYASAQVNRGGATQRDDVAFRGAPDNTRVAVGTLLGVGESSQLQLRYAKDVEFSSGFRNDGEVALRWSTSFR